MKVINRLLIGASLVSMSAAACAQVVTIHPNLQGFNKVNLVDSGQLILKQGAKDSVSIRVPDRAVSYLNVYNSDKTLHLGLKDHPFHLSQAPVYVVTMQHISNITDSNSGVVSVKTPVNTNSLEINVKNSGQINLPNANVDGSASLILHNSGGIHMNRLHAKNITLYLANSGHIQIGQVRSTQLSASIKNSGQIQLHQGQVHQENLFMQNSGRFDAKDVVAQNASVNMQNSGMAMLHVVANISIRKQGSGQLYIYGNPRLNHFEVRNSSGLHIIHS